jgi:hypothetical protein
VTQLLAVLIDCSLPPWGGGGAVGSVCRLQYHVYGINKIGCWNQCFDWVKVMGSSKLLWLPLNRSGKKVRRTMTILKSI